MNTMNISAIQIIGYTYILIGLVYGLYTLLKGSSGILSFFINVLLWPLIIKHVFETYKKYKFNKPTYTFKKVFKNKKAVFFDLDGTLIDTSELWIEAYKKVLKEIGADWLYAENYYTPGVLTSTIWEGIVKSNSLKTNLSIKDIVNKVNQAFVEIVSKSNITPKEGFESFFYEVKVEKGLKTALVTNSPKITADAIIKKLGYQNIFDTKVYLDDVKNPKPNPEIYKKAANLLKLKPQDIIVFEDSKTGVESSFRSNMDTIVIWDRKVPQREYKGKIIAFIPDFEVLVGNLDKDEKELWQEVYERNKHIFEKNSIRK